MLAALSLALVLTTDPVQVPAEPAVASATPAQSELPREVTFPATPSTQAPVQSRQLQAGPARVITARAPSLGTGPTKTICRRERSMDSNIMERVCREVPANSSQRERMGTDMTREMQQMPYNSESGARARSPGGRGVF